jgi:hypothetical protein
MTTTLLAGLAGVLLSLACSYVPGLREWFEALDGTRKRGVFSVALAVVAVGATALSCAGVIATVECTQQGVWTLAQAFVAALVASQGAYLIWSPPVGGNTLPPDVRR